MAAPANEAPKDVVWKLFYGKNYSTLKFIHEDKEKLSNATAQHLKKIEDGIASDVEASDEEQNEAIDLIDLDTLYCQVVLCESDNGLNETRNLTDNDSTNDVSSNDEVHSKTRAGKAKSANNNNFGWQNIQFLPKIIKFIGDLPTKSVLLTPYEYFQLYLTTEVLDLLTEKTNEYYSKFNDDSLDTTANEIQQFIGCNILMGCLNYPRISMYWMPETRNDLIADSMPLKRFFKLRNNLHLTVEEPENNTNIFWKVQPLLDVIKKQFNSLIPEENCCVDEQLVPFKGDFSSKVYRRNKPNPWGIKLYLLCGSNGLIYDFIIYQGATTPIATEIQRKFGEAAGAVYHLAQHLKPGKFYHLFCDSYFISVLLLKELLIRSIYCTGTVKTNCLGPPFTKLVNGSKIEKTLQKKIADETLKASGRGSAIELVSKDKKVCITKWFNNSIVCVASTQLGIGDTTYCQQFCKVNKRKIDIPIPNCIKKYNEGMRGVDLMDYLVGLYKIRIRSKKWTVRLIFHFIDLAVCNSWLQYKNEANLLNLPKTKQLDLLNFRIEIAKALITVNNSSLKKRGMPDSVTPPLPKRTKCENRPLQDSRYDNFGHLPKNTGAKNANRCKLEGCKSKSRTICMKCNVTLCLTSENNCFLKFHSK